MLTLVLVGLIVCLAATSVTASNFRRKLEASLTNDHERRQLSEIYHSYDADMVERYLRSRRRLEEVVIMEKLNTTASRHHKAWMNLPNVPGRLKVSELISFVTSTGAKGESLLWERIIPSARTWMRFLQHNYVIVEDTMLIRFALRQCPHRETAHYTVFECRDEATYLLSRKCSDEYYGWKGPCCKVDDAFNYLVNEAPQLFAQIKYLIHADDDTYWRVDQLLSFLGHLEGYATVPGRDYGVSLSNIPLIGNAAAGKTHDMGVWHIDNCREIMASGWYQPLLLNHAALQRLSLPSKNYGLQQTCKAFDVTHDVGVEVYAWLMSFQHVMIPAVEINGDHKGESVFHPNQMVVHALKHEPADRCSDGHEKDWPEDLRYQQRVVMGCGDIDIKAPFHDAKRIANMYDAFRFFRDKGEALSFGNREGEHGFKIQKVIFFEENEVNATTVRHDGVPSKIRYVKHVLTKSEREKEIDAQGKFQGHVVEEVIMPEITPISGYSQTKHAAQYDIINKEWHDFTLRDCKVPGKVSHRK